MKKDTGGNAFPRIFLGEQRDVECTGMTLRDYFAAKAMQGLLAHGICIVPTGNPNEFSINDHDKMALVSFKFADAMIIERSKE